MIREEIFYTGGEILPKLFYDEILLEDASPIVFTVRDLDSQLYIVSRHTDYAKYVEWIVVPINIDRLKMMLESRITIREAFLDDEYIVTLRYQKYFYTEKKYTTVSTYLDNVLPTAGCYWD